MKSNKPVIGIVPDFRFGGKDQYSLRDFYALRTNHVEAINSNEGAAIILPYDYNLIDDYLNSIDGLLIVGNFFDIDPKRYGEEIHHAANLNKVRENFEFSISEKALSYKIPFLGICNGMQIINIIYGGTVIQHIPDCKDYINHEQAKIKGFDDYSIPYHEVIIKNPSKLYDIVGQEKIMTNSSHYQATKKAGDGLNIVARASDGIIEAIEKPDHPFLVGVQWHPEFAVSEADSKIFKHFVAAAKEYKNSKN